MSFLSYSSYYSSSNYADTIATAFWTTYLVAAIVGLIVACIFGAITKNINENKGYSGGFAWGFWLGVIGIIVVACRERNTYSYSSHSTIANPSRPATEPSTDWVCPCGRSHARYVTRCVCGISKADALSGVKNAKNTESVNINALKEYKELLDQGIISQEEFDQKKAEILAKK